MKKLDNPLIGVEYREEMQERGGGTEWERREIGRRQREWEKIKGE